MAGFHSHRATRGSKVFYFHPSFKTATTWSSPRALKSCWRSSSSPDTRWCSPPRAWSGRTDTWRTNTRTSGRATGSWAQEVCHLSMGWNSFFTLHFACQEVLTLSLNGAQKLHKSNVSVWGLGVRGGPHATSRRDIWSFQVDVLPGAVAFTLQGALSFIWQQSVFVYIGGRSKCATQEVTTDLYRRSGAAALIWPAVITVHCSVVLSWCRPGWWTVSQP